MKKIIFIAAALLIYFYAFPVSAQGVPVSQGKTYDSVTPASTGYPDTAHELTNGVFAAANETGSFYQNPEYVGFNQTAVDENGNFVIIIDLGSVMSDLSSFKISYLNQVDIGIYAPSSVTFSVSDVRNGSYTPVGTATIDEPKTAGTTESNKATVTPEGVVSGQYVMVEVKHLGSFQNENNETVSAGWVFLDEITVNGATADVSSEDVSQADISDIIDETSINIPETGDGINFVFYIILGLTGMSLINSMIKRRKAQDTK